VNRRPQPIDTLPDRADGSSSLVHHSLIITGQLGKIPPLALLPLWALIVVLTGWPWSTLRAPALIVAAVALTLDWTMLALLPRTARSWGPITPPLLGLALVRMVAFWVIELLVPGPLGLGLATAFSAGLWVTAVYATWIEPFAVRVPQETLHVDSWDADTRLRAMHISDIHFERASRREATLLALVERHQPDLLLFTGDYLNLSSVHDPDAHQGVRELLARFTPPLGSFAVTGSPTVDVASVVPGIFAGLPIRWLDDEAVPVDIGEHRLWILGVRNTYDDDRDRRALRALADATPAGDARILLYHTPDLMPLAGELGIDLYLCGHTHGGQIALPLYGALTTGSRWGKRYERGRIREGRTTLYVSRGLGVEGLGAPRARFFAPPEVIVWEFAPPK